MSKHIIRQEAVRAWQYECVGEHKEAQQVRDEMAALPFLHGVTKYNREYAKIKELRGQQLCAHLRSVFGGHQKNQMNPFGQKYHEWLLRNVLTMTEARSCNVVERELITKCQKWLASGEMDVHQIKIATSVLTGPLSRDHVAMGVLEGAMLCLEDPSCGMPGYASSYVDF